MNFDKPKVLPNEIPDILSSYSFGEIIECENLGGIPNNTYKVVTTKRAIALRIYSIGQSSLEHIKIEIDILEHLRQEDFISPRLLPGEDGELLQYWGKYPIIATEYIPGVMADTIEFTPELAYNTGELLNKFRHAMESYSNDSIPNEELFFNKADEIISTIDSDLAKRGWQMDISHVSKQWKKSRQELISNMSKLDTNIIHSDFWPPNLKCEGNKIVGLMDFDDWSFGPMFFDLVVAFLECTMINSDKIHKETAIALFRGYFKTGGKLSDLEQSLFADSVEVFCCLFLAYNIVQAEEFDEANIYLIRLNMLLREESKQSFRNEITEYIHTAKKA